MANVLQQSFSAIRTQEEIFGEISESERLRAIWQGWNEQQQKEFMNFCTGEKGIKILYDSFFKEIMDPDAAPERLEELLSLILGQKIRILKVLPNDSTRIADESSLVIMDIVIELEDHSIANVEVQKLGYKFPGQRAACYSADLLLRQYKRIRGEKERLSVIGISKRYIRSYFTNTVRQNFTGFRHILSIDLHRRQIQGLTLICSRNLYSFRLTIFAGFCTIKVSKISWTHG